MHHGGMVGTRTVASMADFPERDIDQETADDLEFYGGHYVATVAKALLIEGLPVHVVAANGPMNLNGSFYEASLDISFSKAYARTVSPHETLLLAWDLQSGWALCSDFNTEQHDHLVGARWLADGLVPPPQRLAAFMLTAQLGLEAVGSAQRPYYRHDDDDYEELLQQLETYAPDEKTEPHHFASWRGRWESDQETAYQRRLVDDLTADGLDQVVNVPLRRSELRALTRMLDLLEARSSTTSDLVSAFVADLTARTADQSSDQRTAFDIAREMKSNRAPSW